MYYVEHETGMYVGPLHKWRGMALDQQLRPLAAGMLVSAGEA